MLHQLIQGSEAWKLARCGSVGASDAPRVVRRTKTGYSADRDKLLAEKVLERITNRPFERFKTAAMLQGTAREPEARALYSIIKGVEVDVTGLITHPKIAGSHASPDGLIGDRGLLEIKAPEPAAHLETLQTGTISQDYLTQMQWQLACAPDRDWVDFCSYSSDFPTSMQCWVKRVKRNQQYIVDLEREISRFINEIEAAIDRLSRLYGKAHHRDPV